MFRISISFVCFLLGALLASCVTSNLPDTQQIAMLTDGNHPHILSGYGSMKGVRGGRRPYPHNGVDFAAKRGSEVLAAASGVVHKARNLWPCGRGIVLYHPSHDIYTEYCHFDSFAEDAVVPGTIVQRGQVIGYVGTSGRSSLPHVHLGLFQVRGKSKGDNFKDPTPHLVACYDKNKNYRSSEELILTPPVSC